jgi:hypothetical protein
MAYEGELLNFCPATMFDFSSAYAVIVSGMKINPWGHMLLNTGGKGGQYFQVSDVYGDPRTMMAGGGPKLRQGTFPLPLNAANSCQDW